MLKKILGLPLRVVQKILGKKDKPAPKAAPAAPRPRPPAPRPPAPAEGGNDHGHSHGHSHDHGHDHGHEEAPAPPPPPAPKAEKKAKPAPKAAPADDGHDHGHSHDHGHDHGHAAPAPTGNVRVEASDTPNPNARKFTCSITVVEKGSLSFQTADEAKGHPIGRNLWGVGGVKGIFAVKDFITVTKEDAADWTSLTPKLVTAIQQGLAER